MDPETLHRRDWDFEHEVLHARDMLAMIASGEIERGRRVSTYDFKAGKRPMKMADAKDIARREVERLNIALNKFIDSEPKPWDWNELLKPTVVHVEPKDLIAEVSELCADCKQSTRYWTEDCHTPLCQECCDKRNAATAKLQSLCQNQSPNSRPSASACSKAGASCANLLSRIETLCDACPRKPIDRL